MTGSIIITPMSAGENLELNDLIVTQPQWGFIHAGTKLLSDSAAGFEGLTLADIEDVGITLQDAGRSSVTRGIR